MNYEKSNLFSMKCLWKEMVNINMFNLIKEIKVPVYFAVGRHDYQTPSLIAKEYLEKFAEWMESQFRKDDKKHSDPSDVMHIIWSYKIWEFVEFLKQHAEYGNITDFEKKRQETV